jgi:hypothetical protein
VFVFYNLLAHLKGCNGRVGRKATATNMKTNVETLGYNKRVRRRASTNKKAQHHRPHHLALKHNLLGGSVGEVVRDPSTSWQFLNDARQSGHHKT